MKASDVITPARRILNDEDESNYRWSNTVLLRYLTWTYYAVCGLAPHLFLGDDGTTSSPAELDDLDDPLVLDDDYVAPLSHQVAAQALSEDNDDTMNLQRANELTALFLLRIVGKIAK